MTPAPRGNLRAIQREQTRLRIIDAAIEVLAARGYVRTTVDDIAEKACTTRTTFYLHFKTKADLMPELIIRNLAHFDDLYQQLANVSIEPEVNRVRHWIEAVMETWDLVAATARPLFEAAAVEVKLYDQLVRAENAQVGHLASALTQSAHIGNHDDAFILASALLAPLNHYFRLFLYEVEFDRSRVVDVLARTWVAVMSATSFKDT